MHDVVHARHDRIPRDHQHLTTQRERSQIPRTITTNTHKETPLQEQIPSYHRHVLPQIKIEIAELEGHRVFHLGHEGLKSVVTLAEEDACSSVIPADLNADVRAHVETRGPVCCHVATTTTNHDHEAGV